MEKAHLGAFLLGEKNEKDNTQPASKLALGAKFQFVGDVRDGRAGGRGLEGGGR